MDLESIKVLRKYLTIDKHQPGNITIKFSLGLLSDSNAMKIIKENKNKDMPKAILKSDLSLFSRKLTLGYDVNAISFDDLTEIFTTSDNNRFDQLAEKYLTVLS